jgi:hypothetical protein
MEVQVPEISGRLNLINRTEDLLKIRGRSRIFLKMAILSVAVGIRHADQATPLYRYKLALTSPTNGGRSVGIVRSRTQATEFSVVGMKLETASVV